MSKSWDAIVIGAGVMGGSAAWRLAGAGLRTLLLEQFAVGHERGSSHGPSRIIRLSYDEALYTERMPRAYALWEELESETGSRLVHRVGGIDLGSPDVPSWHDTRHTLEQFEIPFETLTSTDLRRRFPQFTVPDNEIGLWQADTGILPAGRCVSALVRAARQRGATLLEDARVVALQPQDDGLSLRLENGEEHSAPQVVLAAGPWTGPLLEPLGRALPLEVTQEQVAYFRPRHGEAFQPDRFPVFIRHEEEFVYGFPCFEGDLVKIALHHGGPVTTADERTFEPDEAALTHLRGWVVTHLPSLDPEPVRIETCLYTNTPDRDFVIDSPSGLDGLIVAAGFSGHGFKFGPWVGETIAERVTGRASEAPHPRFAFDRF